MYKENTEKKKLYKAFCKKYKQINPLIIFKTLEYSKTLGEAFDALEDYNGDLPIVWSYDQKKWIPEVLAEYEFLNDR